jgi:hypothetical protein
MPPNAIISSLDGVPFRTVLLFIVVGVLIELCS